MYVMLHYSILLYIITTTYVLANENESRVVNIDQGPVRGYKLKDYNIFAFHGIPYATAPTGVNKFMPPLLPPTWDEPLNATQDNIICPQSNNLFKTFDGMQVLENCLVSSIYIPDTNKTNLPVIVYVHGGAYQIGYSTRFTPHHVVHSTEVIVAVFNYRLGAHGFLCLGTKNIPGNAGMKDQIAFLRWVQKNIGYFGGNPDDVTVYGNSAGSRSVDLLMISKATSGLFNKVNAESGGSLSAQTVQVDPVGNAKYFAQLLNFSNVNDIDALEAFYLDSSYEILTSIDTIKLKRYLFTPCVERDVGDEVVLDESPFEILKNGKYNKVPMFYGFTEMEGTYQTQNFEQWKDEMNQNFSEFLPDDLKFSSEKEKEDVAQIVREYYFGDKIVNEENILLFVNYYTDIVYVYPMLRALKLHMEAGHKQIYLYEFSFTSAESSKIVYIDLPVAVHSWQTLVFFDSENESEQSDELKEMKKTYREMSTNFVIFGEPCPPGTSLPSWSPTTHHNMQIMSLNQTIHMKPLKHRALFWDDIYERYHKEPSVPIWT